jgi:drug/metabolite transporter (DMT)-like permease
MTTAILIGIIVLSNAAGDVLTTRAMKQVGEVSTLKPRELLSIVWKVLPNMSFLSGIFFFTVAFSAFLTVLSWADLSLVFPATALVYVVGALGAKFILKETVTLQRWAGILIVCLGVALISMP